MREAERLSPRIREGFEGGERLNEAFNFKGFAGRMLPEVDGIAGVGRGGAGVGGKEEVVGLGIAAGSGDDLPEIK